MSGALEIASPFAGVCPQPFELDRQRACLHCALLDHQPKATVVSGSVDNSIEASLFRKTSTPEVFDFRHGISPFWQLLWTLHEGLDNRTVLTSQPYQLVDATIGLDLRPLLTQRISRNVSELLQNGF